MSDRRTRSMNGSSSDSVQTSATRAAAIAVQLQEECSNLMELYRKREGFPEDVADGLLVSVPPLSSQLGTIDKLWLLYSALLKCRSLLERAIAKEDEELGCEEGEYEEQRRTVKDRLLFLLNSTGELLKAADGTTILTPSLEGSELDGPTALFELKLWVYRIFREVDHWTKVTISTLRELLSSFPKEPTRTMRVRSKRSTRR